MFLPRKDLEYMLKVNDKYKGQNLNHMHVCELKILYGKKAICSRGVKNKRMNSFNDECDTCSHNRCIGLSDDGSTITGIT